MKTIIEVKQLVHRYGERTAINDLSFSIQAGEVMGLLGPNGAGKTSTVRLFKWAAVTDQRGNAGIRVRPTDTGPGNPASDRGVDGNPGALRTIDRPPEPGILWDAGWHEHNRDPGAVRNC